MVAQARGAKFVKAEFGRWVKPVDEDAEVAVWRAMADVLVWLRFATRKSVRRLESTFNRGNHPAMDVYSEKLEAEQQTIFKRAPARRVPK